MNVEVNHSQPTSFHQGSENLKVACANTPVLNSCIFNWWLCCQQEQVALQSVVWEARHTITQVPWPLGSTVSKPCAASASQKRQSQQCNDPQGWCLLLRYYRNHALLFLSGPSKLTVPKGGKGVARITTIQETVAQASEDLPYRAFVPVPFPSHPRLSDSFFLSLT